jgi:hypothetical protein
MWISNAVMYVTVPYNKVLFSFFIFLTSQSEVDFGIALVLPWLNLFIYITNFILEFDIFIYVLGQRLLLSCFYFDDFLFILSRCSTRRSHSHCTTDSLSVLAPSPPPPTPTPRHMTGRHKVMRLTISVLAASGWDLSCVQNLGLCQLHVLSC